MSLQSRYDQDGIKETATVEDDPVQWWYVNALIEAPGTPIDGWALICTMLRFGSALEEGRFVLMPPQPGDQTIDFGTRRLPPGSLQASTESVDVRIGANSLRGGYPELELDIAGTTRDGVACAAQLSYHAQLEPEQLTHLDGQLRHFACYKLGAEGTITIDGASYQVRAVGFYERVYGSMGWDSEEGTVHTDGWNWYWSPAVGPEDLAVEVWSFFVEGEDQPDAYVAVTDGETWHRFTSGVRTIEETREIHGVPYPHKIRVTDKNDAGELDLVITRRDIDGRSLTGPGRPLRMYFITGFADFEGTARIGGREYQLNGQGFGSVYEMSTEWT